jgi:hypothetical protein
VFFGNTRNDSNIELMNYDTLIQLDNDKLWSMISKATRWPDRSPTRQKWQGRVDDSGVSRELSAQVNLLKLLECPNGGFSETSFKTRLLTFLNLIDNSMSETEIAERVIEIIETLSRNNETRFSFSSFI